MELLLLMHVYNIETTKQQKIAPKQQSVRTELVQYCCLQVCLFINPYMDSLTPYEKNGYVCVKR